MLFEYFIMRLRNVLFFYNIIYNVNNDLFGNFIN